jgi:prophage regulatory protein
MTSKSDLPAPKILPHDGCSRWSQFAPFSPVCRETFRRLSIAGRAPKPIRMGIRCTFYRNQELHKFLVDPLGYKSEEALEGVGNA